MLLSKQFATIPKRSRQFEGHHVFNTQPQRLLFSFLLLVALYLSQSGLGSGLVCCTDCLWPLASHLVLITTVHPVDEWVPGSRRQLWTKGQMDQISTACVKATCDLLYAPQGAEKESQGCFHKQLN